MSSRKPAAWWGVLLLSVAVVIPLACGGDDPVTPPVTQSEYQNLTAKTHVLNNLELACNRRQVDKYSNLLDVNFTMIFSAADVLGGKTPEQWGRQEELDASRNLFNVNWQDPDGLQPRCLKIFVDVKWEDGVEWQEITPESAPTETWYTATVYYNFQFDIEPDLHLINNAGSKAQFTVRNAGTDSAPHWQLVEMRDLSGTSIALAVARSTEQSTWGQIKAIYR